MGNLTHRRAGSPHSLTGFLPPPASIHSPANSPGKTVASLAEGHITWEEGLPGPRLRPRERCWRALSLPTPPGARFPCPTACRQVLLVISSAPLLTGCSFLDLEHIWAFLFTNYTLTAHPFCNSLRCTPQGATPTLRPPALAAKAVASVWILRVRVLSVWTATKLTLFHGTECCWAYGTKDGLPGTMGGRTTQLGNKEKYLCTKMLETENGKQTRDAALKGQAEFNLPPSWAHDSP